MAFAAGSGEVGEAAVAAEGDEVVVSGLLVALEAERHERYGTRSRQSGAGNERRRFASRIPTHLCVMNGAPGVVVGWDVWAHPPPMNRARTGLLLDEWPGPLLKTRFVLQWS